MKENPHVKLSIGIVVSVLDWTSTENQRHASQARHTSGATSSVVARDEFVYEDFSKSLDHRGEGGLGQGHFDKCLA